VEKESPDTAFADAGAFPAIAAGLAAASRRIGGLLTEVIDVAVRLAAFEAAGRSERTVRNSSVFDEPG
jgi:hypothetical protein